MEPAEALRLRVARNVKRLRQLKGWTQDDLAAQVGNTDRHVSQIERGETNLTLDYLAKIAGSLSADAADLFFDDDASAARPPGAIAIFVTPAELKLLDQARHLLSRVQELARPVAAGPTPPTSRSDSGDDQL